MRFHELNLSSDLMRGIEDAGFTECTPVQEQTFKLILEEGRDATVQSQTGTGKTAAFLVSIFEIFERSKRENEGARSHAALVVVPTRELAVQVEDEAKLLGHHLSYRIGSVFGGVGYGQQERLLEQGADIIIGTPGRLLDFSSSRKLDLRGFDILVLDEADRMLDMGFLPDMKRILRALPPAEERRTMLFSATLETRVKHLAWEYMNNPGEIEVAPEHVTVEDVTQELYHVTRKEKVGLLLGLLEREKPANALIFTNMKSTAVELSKRLSQNGFPTEYIMGDLPQRKRLALIDGIKEGRIKFLVATDVAARGLHIDDLDLVVNFDIPEDYELYVHRIGRTARAGKRGKAITLACERYVYGLEAIESFIGQKIPVVWPDEGLFKRDAAAGIDLSERRSRRGRPEANDARSSRRPARPAASRGKAPFPAKEGGTKRQAGHEQRPAAKPADAVPTGPAAGSPNRMNASTNKRPPRRPQHTPARSGQIAATAEKPAANASIEDRLSYYKKKYGEDFEVKRPSDERRATPKPDDRPRQQAPGAGSRPERPRKQPQSFESRPERPSSDAPVKPQQPSGFLSKLKGLFKRH